MNTTTTEAHPLYGPAEESAPTRAASGLFMEAIGAIAVIALSIVGLAGALSITMAAIGTIVVGAAILIEGGTFASSYARFASQTGEASRAQDWSGLLTAEFLGGVAGVVLGILALLGSFPTTLLAVAALVYGATFLISSFASVDSGSRTMVGLGSFVLGLLAVNGISPLTMVLVALLCLGAVALFSGATTGARMMAAARK